MYSELNCMCFLLLFIQQQGNFETLLDWFTHDWFDDDNDERRGNKMNWRLLYLKNIKKRSKARFNSKLNNVRKKEGNKSSDKESSDKQTKKDSMQKKYKPSDVPWDTIVPEIFILTVLSMDEASIKLSITINSIHSKIISNDRSLSFKVFKYRDKV